MAYFTKEEIEKARGIDLLSYLQIASPEEIIYDSRGTYRTATHDSLKISNGLWYWFSRGIGGKSAIDYLMKVEEYSFVDAVSKVLEIGGYEKIKPPINYKSSKNDNEKKLILPRKAKNNFKVIDYLLSRGISKNIIDECINKGLIYQDVNDNVVFVGYDNRNIARYAGIRATNSSRYMHDSYGSNKTYSFKLKSICNKKSVHIFESVIDLLSYATLKEMSNKNWDEDNLLSLAGVYSTSKDISNSKLPKTVENFLRENPQIKTIFVHFDNDLAGRLGTEAIKNKLSASYEIIDFPPKSGKDFNDFLCEIVKKNEMKGYDKSR